MQSLPIQTQSATVEMSMSARTNQPHESHEKGDACGCICTRRACCAPAEESAQRIRVHTMTAKIRRPTLESPSRLLPHTDAHCPPCLRAWASSSKHLRVVGAAIRPQGGWSAEDPDPGTPFSKGTFMPIESSMTRFQHLPAACIWTCSSAIKVSI